MVFSAAACGKAAVCASEKTDVRPPATTVLQPWLSWRPLGSLTGLARPPLPGRDRSLRTGTTFGGAVWLWGSKAWTLLGPSDPATPRLRI